MSHIGNNKSQRYKCDVCEKEFNSGSYRGRVYKYFLQTPADYYPRKNFDLCSKCNKKFKAFFKGWKEEKDIKTVEEIIGEFPRYEEE